MAAVLIPLGLIVGYATAGGGYREVAPSAPTPLVSVRSHVPKVTTPKLATVAVTRSLHPTAAQLRSSRTARTVKSAAATTAPVTPAVVTPVRPLTPTPSSGSNDNFDSSG